MSPPWNCRLGEAEIFRSGSRSIETRRCSDLCVLQSFAQGAGAGRVSPGRARRSCRGGAVPGSCPGPALTRRRSRSPSRSCAAVPGCTSRCPTNNSVVRAQALSGSNLEPTHSPDPTDFANCKLYA